MYWPGRSYFEPAPPIDKETLQKRVENADKLLSELVEKLRDTRLSDEAGEETDLPVGD